MRHWRTRQGIERLEAGLALIALDTTFVAPTHQMTGVTMRTRMHLIRTLIYDAFGVNRRGAQMDRLFNLCALPRRRF